MEIYDIINGDGLMFRKKTLISSLFHTHLLNMLKVCEGLSKTFSFSIRRTFPTIFQRDRTRFLALMDSWGKKIPLVISYLLKKAILEGDYPKIANIRFVLEYLLPSRPYFKKTL